MLELIERLEKAESGSRDFDADMSIVIFDSQVKRERQILQSFVHHMGDGDWSVIPAYTTSLDAIVALIGEKLPGWSVVIRLPGEAKHKHTCEVAAPDDPAASITDPWPFRTSAGASSAPLAACIALLRAIQTKESGHDQ